MGFQNEVIFTTAATPDDWSDSIAEICYARLFHNDWEDEIDAHRYVLSAFRLDKDCSVLRANWWLRNILERCPPELTGGFSVSRTSPQIADIVRGHYARGKPWINVCFDGAKLGGTEIYMMLSLLRYPQERPDIVGRTRMIQKLYGLPFDQSYLIAGSSDDHSGHGMVCTNTWCDMKNKSPQEIRKIVEDYSLKEVILDVVGDRHIDGTFLENNRKSTANRYFQPKGTKYNAWGSGHKVDPEERWKPGYVEPKVGQICKYWLDLIGYKEKEVAGNNA
jgi:hypothetical protein